MIKINLLPDAYKTARESRQQKLPINLILLSVNGVLLVIFLVVSAISVSRFITLGALNTRLQGLAPEQQKIIDIQRKTENLRSTNVLFSPIVSNRFLWAKKLNLLSDLILPGIWFRRLSLEKVVDTKGQVPTQPELTSRYVKVEASVVGVGRDEMSIIGDFVRALKTDKEFFQHFKGIDLEGVLRRQVAGVEVMDFTLICPFKQEVEL